MFYVSDNLSVTVTGDVVVPFQPTTGLGLIYAMNTCSYWIHTYAEIQHTAGKARSRVSVPSAACS